MESEKKILVMILLFFILSSTLGVLARPTGDGAWHLGIIRFIAENHKIPSFEPLGRSLFTRPPLYHVISAFFYVVFAVISENAAEIMVKILPSVFGALAVYFTYFIVKKLFNEEIAFYAAFFFAFLPLYFFVSFRTMPTVLGVLLTTVAVYFALEKRIILAGFFTGLSLLAKEQSIFILPPILFIIFFSGLNRKKSMIKNVFLFTLLVAVIASPVYISNLIKFGDPIWPHGYFLFKSPYEKEGMSTINPVRSPLNISNALNMQYSVIHPYLEFFGVPHITSMDFLFSLDMPFLRPLLLLWFIASLVYLVPLVYGFLKINKKSFGFRLILVWFGSFFSLMYFFLLVVGRTLSGYLLSGIPCLAAVWGFGFFSITKKFGSLKNFIFLIYILISVGFIMSATIKIVYTNNAHQFYQKDFNWIKANVPETDVVYFNSQSLTYETRRFSNSFSNLSNLKSGFVLVNQNYTLNSGLAILSQEMVEEIENSSRLVLVYNNNITGTKIYHIED